MFGLRLPARVRVGKPLVRKLRLESLETRENPDGGFGDPPPTPPPSSPPPQMPANAAPVILNFSAEETGNGYFLITGRVSDETPASAVVTLGGSTSCSGTQIAVGADGSFSQVVVLHTDGTDSGYITATATDALGLHSQQVQVYVNPTG